MWFCRHLWLMYSVAVRQAPQSVKFGKIEGPGDFVENTKKDMLAFAEGATYVVQRCQKCRTLRDYTLLGAHNNIKVEWAE